MRIDAHVDENDPFNANCHEARNAQPMRLDAISKDGLGAATPHDFQKVALEKLDQNHSRLQVVKSKTDPAGLSLFITALAMKNAAEKLVPLLSHNGTVPTYDGAAIFKDSSFRRFPLREYSKR
jgi:hypothetical protein